MKVYFETYGCKVNSYETESMTADFLSDGSSSETEYIAREVGKAISDYVRGLSEKRRFIFVGRFYIGETVESIAQDLGLTSSAVYKELEKLKKGLKTQLERNGYI